MSPDVLLEGPRTSFRYVLRVNVTERVWIFPVGGRGVNALKPLISLEFAMIVYN